MLEPFPNVFCRTHSDFSRLHKDLYLEVGIHVNSLGQYFLYWSYRGAILMLWVFLGHRRFHHTPFYVYCLELIKQSAIIMDEHRPCSLFHFTALSFVFNVIYCILFFLSGTFFLFCLPSRFRPQGCYYYYLPLRFRAQGYYSYLTSRFCPQDYYYYLPSRFRPQGCYYDYLPSRFCPQVCNYYYLPSRFCPQGCYYYHLTSRFRPQGCYYFLPSRFRPQGYYNYLPSRFCPQGCFIYHRGFALEVVLFTFEVSPSRLC